MVGSMHKTQVKDDVEFTPLKGTRSLKGALYISGPYDVEDAPNAYSFERSNLIRIDWPKVLNAAGVTMPATNSS